MNEWNISASSLGPFVTREYELKNLTGKEIKGLLDLLERHGALKAQIKVSGGACPRV
ncbi:MAG: hypothetical protein U0529_08905 [Thermoanaerobaculia bacterium]